MGAPGEQNGAGCYARPARTALPAAILIAKKAKLFMGQHN